MLSNVIPTPVKVLVDVKFTAPTYSCVLVVFSALVLIVIGPDKRSVLSGAKPPTAASNCVLAAFVDKARGVAVESLSSVEAKRIVPLLELRAVSFSKVTAPV